VVNAQQATIRALQGDNQLFKDSINASQQTHVSVRGGECVLYVCL
jgi:hypothetical protein